ncbi:MAG: putative toxin-antitoxin system toxin component, PIN family, partial [Burkholderiales bacterium]|nr:putative toxin-antitoxin system toxin component, PIN family [Burkholderiales bacterium]
MLDTNVVASALLWRGPPRLLVQAGRDKRVELFTSTALLAELTHILGRRKFGAKILASTLTVDQLVDRYAVLAAVVRPTPIPRVAPDPDDVRTMMWWSEPRLHCGLICLSPGTR